MPKENINLETFCPTSRQEWRQWLEENHISKQSIWLIAFKKSSGKPSVSWSETVDEALCFGWIDSTRKSIDEESFMQFFTKRKATSVWSKINKEKVARLMAEGLIAPAGHESIEKAKQNGSWTILDEVEELIIPVDLEKAFKEKPGSKDFFLSLGKSMKKRLLQWLVLAKQDATRQKRIKEIAECAAQKMTPKGF
jgi:uncharacterized protein YdeI (YjbR/CyaY-like superfamily)